MDPLTDTAGAVPDVARLVKFKFFRVIPWVLDVAMFTTPLVPLATILTWFCATEEAAGPTIVTVWVPLIAIDSGYVPALTTTVGTPLFCAALTAALIAVN